MFIIEDLYLDYYRSKYSDTVRQELEAKQKDHYKKLNVKTEWAYWILLSLLMLSNFVVPKSSKGNFPEGFNAFYYITLAVLMTGKLVALFWVIARKRRQVSSGELEEEIVRRATQLQGQALQPNIVIELLDFLENEPLAQKDDILKQIATNRERAQAAIAKLNEESLVSESEVASGQEDPLFQLNRLEIGSIIESLSERISMLDKRRDAVIEEAESLRSEIDAYRRSFRRKSQIDAIREASQVDVVIAGEMEIIEAKVSSLFLRCQTVRDKLTTIQQEVSSTASAALEVGFRPTADIATQEELQRRATT